MATIVDALGITLGLDAKGVQTGMKQAENSISAGLKSITSMLAPLAGGLAFKGLLDNYVTTVDALGKAADRIGVSITELDAWGQAVKHSGGSAEGFQHTLEGLNSQLQMIAATGEGRAKKAFETLGISAKDAAGNAREPFEVLEELAQKAGTMSAAQFAGLAKRMGLDEGTIRLLQTGGEEVDKLIARMRKLAYTEEDKKAAADYNDSMQDLQKSFTKAASVVLREVVPAISFLADKFAAFVGRMSKNGGVGVAAFLGIAAVIGAKVIPALKNMDAVWMKSKSLLTISAIAAAVMALYLVIEDFIVYCKGGKSALGDLWSVFGTGEEITQWFKDAWTELKQIGTQVWDALKAAAQWFFGYFGGAIEPLKNTFKELFGMLKSLFTGDFKGFIEHAKGFVVNFASTVKELILGAFRAVFDVGKGIFSELWGWLTGLFGKIGDFIVNGLKAAIRHVPSFLLPDSVKNWANSETIKSNAEAVQAGTPASGDAARPVETSSTSNVDSHSETTVSVGEVNVQTNATDAEGTALATKNEILRLANSHNGAIVDV